MIEKGVAESEQVTPKLSLKCPENRHFCRSCRFEKCVAVGMNPQGTIPRYNSFLGIRSEDLENNQIVQTIIERKVSQNIISIV